MQGLNSQLINKQIKQDAEKLCVACIAVEIHGDDNSLKHRDAVRGMINAKYTVDHLINYIVEITDF